MKRVISILLALALLLSFSVTAFAAQEKGTGATVVFKSVDVYGDGTGFQLLLDKDASTCDVIFDYQAFFEGANYITGDISSAIYNQFEYKLPTNADGKLTTTNILIDGTLTTTVPAGTYDIAITNPTPSDEAEYNVCYIATNGSFDDLVLRDGCTYTFTMTAVEDAQGYSDAVVVFSTDDPDIGKPREVLSQYGTLLKGWYFEDEDELDGAVTIDADGDGFEWASYADPTGGFPVKEGVGCLNSESYDNTTETALTPDNWVFSQAVALPANAESITLSYFVGAPDAEYYAEHYGVYVATAQTIASATKLTEETLTTADFVNKTVDLTAYAGQTVYLAFRHFSSTDVYIISLDQVEVYYKAGSQHVHSHTAVVTPPTCTQKGYTTYTCACGDSYKADYTDVIAHTFAEGVCSVCGAKETEEKPCDGGDTCPGKEFSDMPAATNWAHKGIDFALKNKLMNGVGDGKFDPKGSMTRAMLVTVLWRYSGSPEPKGANPFTDVPDGKWFTKAIIWAAENGIVNGVGDGKFSPNGNITREQMATILFRFSKEKAGAGDLSDFADADKVGSYANDGMIWAVANKLIGGSTVEGKNFLDPKDNATREQVAAILMRFMER